MKKKIIFVLIISLISNTIAQNCGNPTPATDLIDFGKLTLMRRGGSRQHCFNVPVNYNIPNTGRFPDIAVSITKIQGYSGMGGFDYSVSAGRKGTSNAIGINVQINEDGRWMSLQITYLISSNANFIIGSFIGNLFPLTSCANDQMSSATSIQTYIPSSRINQALNYKVAAFISGFRSFANNFSLKPVSGDISKADGRIVVNIQSNANPGIQYIYVTYCIYPATTVNNIDFGIGNVNAPSSYRLQGLTSVQGRTLLYNQFVICKKVPNCGQNEVFMNGKCECSQGFIKINQICMMECTKNGYYDIQGNCVCLDGFNFNRQGQCVEGRQNNINDNRNNNNRNTRNNCNGPNQILINNRLCGCVQGYYMNKGQCVSICKDNQVWNGRTCECAQGFFRRNQNQPCLQQVSCRSNQINVGGSCQCSNGFNRNSAGNCVPVQINCGQNQQLDSATKNCICRDGLTRVGTTCIFVAPKSTSNCPPDSSPNQNGVCNCNFNLQWNSQKTVCVPRTCGQNSFQTSKGCVCLEGFQWSYDGTSCISSSSPTSQCPLNSKPDAQQKCNCNPGYKKSQDGQTCIAALNCPTNSFISPQGKCVCNTGLYLQNNQCIPIPTCPPNSSWNQNKLQCACSIQGQYLIDKVCKACSTNQIWNDKQCICKQGLFRISGACRVCDMNTSYNGTDCVCNFGFFGNRDKCDKCDSSCGKCSGPQSNKCIQCIDITYTLSNGYCTKSTPCPPSYYLNGSSCSKCSDYCQQCASQLQCAQCADGFKIQLQVVDGLGYSSCAPQCGDGRKVDVQQCDDGNKKDGDGCSSQCKIQKDWSCSNGTSVQKSKCIKSIPNKSMISVKGSVNMVGKVVQGVRLSYIPKCFTDKDCIDCFKILNVNVIQSNISVLITVGFVPNSDGQFIVTYDFGGAITSTYFKYLIRINENLPAQYKNCFTPEDYAQQVVNTIDTATLARNDKTDKLTLNDLLDSGPEPSPILPPAPSTNSKSNETVLGYPINVINMIFKQ